MDQSDYREEELTADEIKSLLSCQALIELRWEYEDMDICLLPQKYNPDSEEYTMTWGEEEIRYLNNLKQVYLPTHVTDGQ